MTPSYVDLHCHPSLKPYGKSFNGTPGQNSPDREDEKSLWFYDSPNFFEAAIQMFTGICKFRQSDLTSLAHGNVRIVCASLYPIERGFFNNKIGSGPPSDIAAAFVTSAGLKRVNYIQSIKNYFEDLEREYNYYRQCEGKPCNTDSGIFSYALAKDYSTIETALLGGNNTIVIVMTIEGMHVLHEDIDKPDEAIALQNVQKIKNWPHVPFFVTFAHHFNNHFCGHAKSLFGIVGKNTDQSKGLGDPFNDTGRKVIRALLDNKNGRRIYIDIKHMSAKARHEYIDMVLNDPVLKSEKIPIIISHGAATGRRSMNDDTIDIKPTGEFMLNEDINFYDDEIVAMAKSKGIMGLQLDERRIANEKTLKAVKHSPWLGKIRHYRAKLLWNQVQHIAELLDKNGLNAWDSLAIGSDFDGILDPLNGYLTQETMVFLEQYFERYAFNYMSDRGKKLKPKNQIPADEIVQRIFYDNAWNFIRNYYVRVPAPVIV